MRWSKRKPEAAAYLETARAAITEVSARVGVPAENLVSPDLVRRLCWDWAPRAGVDDAVEEFLSRGGARGWQRALVAPALAGALKSPPPASP